MVDRARLLSKADGGNWIDLSQLGRNQIRSSIKAQIHPDGRITGTRQTGYTGQHAANFRRNYHAAKDSAEFITKLETEENIKVKTFSTTDVNAFSSIVRRVSNLKNKRT